VYVSKHNQVGVKVSTLQSNSVSLFPYIRCSSIKETCNSEFSHQQEFKNPLPANQMEADFYRLVS